MTDDITGSPSDFGMDNLTPEEEMEFAAIVDRQWNEPGTPVASPIAGVEQEPVLATSETAPPAPDLPPPPVEYQLGHITVPEADAPTVASIYTFLRNNPNRAAELQHLISSPPPPPVWNQEPTPPPPPVTQYIPPQPQYQPPQIQAPQIPGVPSAPPPNLEFADETVRYVYDRQQLLEQQNAQLQQAQYAWNQQQAQNAQRQAAETAAAATRAMVEQNVQAGVARFKSAHPDISEADFQSALSDAASLNLVAGLKDQMPYDQAVERALELTYAQRVSTSSPTSTKPPDNARRQQTLTSLSGSSGAASPRSETLPKDPRLMSDAETKSEALRLIQASGLGSLTGNI